MLVEGVENIVTVARYVVPREPRIICGTFLGHHQRFVEHKTNATGYGRSVRSDEGRVGSAAVEFSSVSKTYPDGTQAVADLSLRAEAEELLVLVGPSGCGKSTTLRMVNRLITPTTGTVSINGENIAERDPVVLRRNIGYVIQHVGLFPHRTVAQNIATVPHLLGWKRPDIDQRTVELLDLVGLDPEIYRNRYPSELSGGQQQRVGVARALAARPPVLLMDEPFGAVDPIGRRRLQTEFRRIQRQVRTTVLFVTHDLDEAVTLGDQVAVFSQGGKLEQVASPLELLARPGTDFVREFIGDGRSIRLLGITELSRDHVHANGFRNGAASPHTELRTPTLRLGMRLDEVFDALTQASLDQLPVADEQGDVVGVVTPQKVLDAVRATANDAAS